MASAASTAPQRATKAALARELGVSRQAVGDLVKRGILTEDRDGLIDIELAKLALANRIRPSAKTAASLGQEPNSAPLAAAGENKDKTTDDGVVTSYHVAKTLNEAAQARMNQLKLREMQGELIRLDAVESAWSQALSATREHLLQVRARLAPMLAQETDPFKIEQLLDAEHSQALQHMAAASLQPSVGAASAASAGAPA